MSCTLRQESKLPGLSICRLSNGWCEEHVLAVNTVDRMIAPFRQDLGRSPVQPAAQSKFSYKIRALSSWCMKSSKDGNCKASGLNLLHCLTSHGEKVFWIFHLSLSCFNLCPLSLFLQPCITVKSPSLSSWYPPMGASRLLVGPHPSSFSWVGRGSHSCLSAEIYFIIGEARGYWKIQLLMISKATELGNHSLTS